MITLTKYKISLFYLILLGLLNLSFFVVNSGGVLQLIQFVLLVLLPGVLASSLLNLKPVHVAEKAVLIVGLGIASIMTVCYLNNIILPIFGVNHPLSGTYLLRGFNIFIIVTGLINMFIHQESIVITLPVLNRIHFIVELLIVSLLSATSIGVQVLNNGGSNILVLSVLIFIIFAVLVAVLLRNRLSDNHYALFLYVIGLSLLFTYSLRSLHLNGWDVQSEFRVFQITLREGRWLPQFHSNAYYSMLSITVLPTFFKNILHISDEYIYKLLYPIVYAFSTVGIYFFLRKYVDKITALLAVVFFMIQNQFFQQMPALARQEIGSLFFILALYSLFSYEGKTYQKKLLFIIYSFAMIVSHYSTAYIAIAMYAGALILNYISAWIYRKIHPNEKVPKFMLDPVLVLIVISFTFLWYSQITSTNIFFKTFADNTISKLNKIYSNEFKSDAAKLAIVGVGKEYTTKDVAQYDKLTEQEYKKDKTWITYYDSDTTSSYKPVAMYAEKIPVQKPWDSIVFYTVETVKKTFKLMLGIGTIYIAYLLFFRRKTQFDLEYLNFIVVSLTFLVAIVVVPNISVAYNFERMYQQMLVFLSVVIITASMWALQKLNNKGIYIVFVMIVIYFCNTSYIFNQIVGGTPGLNLNSFGEEYQRFYIHDAEVKSAQWLQKHYDPKSSVYADQYGALRLQSWTSIDKGIVGDITPKVLDKYGYVYATYTNLIKNVTRSTFKNTYVAYLFPKLFLENNKNIIYSTGVTNIYK